MKYVPPQEENEILKPPKDTNDPQNNARVNGKQMPTDDDQMEEGSDE